MTEDIIVIPDVHGRTFWREVVEKYPDNDTIFLGDYLDPYPGEGISADDALANFEEIIALAKTRSNVTLLAGNHDLHYLCNFGEDCRLDYINSAKIHFMLMDNLWLFRLAVLREIGGHKVIFTHAPILMEWVEAVGESTDPAELTASMNSMLRRVQRNPWDVEGYLGQISGWKGGNLPFGSPVWADLYDLKSGRLIPTVDLSVFGHTQLESKPVIRPGYACVDCREGFRLTPDLELLPVRG